jgi:hypothetical protein
MRRVATSAITYPIDDIDRLRPHISAPIARRRLPAPLRHPRCILRSCSMPAALVALTRTSADRQRQPAHLDLRRRTCAAHGLPSDDRLAYTAGWARGCWASTAPAGSWSGRAARLFPPCPARHAGAAADIWAWMSRKNDHDLPRMFSQFFLPMADVSRRFGRSTTVAVSRCDR